MIYMTESNNGNGVKISSREIYDILTKLDKNLIVLQGEFKIMHEKIEQLNKKYDVSTERIGHIENKVAEIKSKLGITWYMVAAIVVSLIGIAFKSFGG